MIELSPCSCGKNWTGSRRCHCVTCHETFSSASAFDKHRKNFKCLAPASRSLVLVDGYWGQAGNKPRLAYGARRKGTKAA